jgi:RimJ/RimL family protein N-acetyltransferase
MGPTPHEVELRDGTRVLVRPILPEDKDRLRRGLALLSPRSRYLRFHSPVTAITDQQLRYLTEVDYRDHMAWVAIDRDRPADPGMGVARYVRLPDEPAVAEAAITVADDYQGRGLGSVLLRVLGRSATEQGIRTFRSYVLDENVAMRRIFDRLGARREREEAGVWRIDLDLTDLDVSDETGDAPPSLAKRVLHAAASGRLPMPVFDPPVWRGTDGRSRVLKRRPHHEDAGPEAAGEPAGGD